MRPGLVSRPRSVQRVLVIGAVVVGCLATLPATALRAYACSCAPATPQQYAAAADAVFTGTVTTLVTPAPAPSGVIGGGQNSVAFNVETVYKGHLGRTATVTTAAEGATCGIEFQTGRRYTVFASQSQGQFSAGLCGGTVAGTIDPREYGFVGAVPSVGVGADQAVMPSGWFWGLAATGWLVGLGLVGLGFSIRRRP